MQKILITLAATLLIISLYQMHSLKGDDDDIPPGVYDSFTHYEVDFNKVYATPEERSYRLHVFYANFLRIMDFMEDEDVTYALAYTIFSDRTAEEYQESLIRIDPIDYLDFDEITFDVTDLPSSVDWRKERIVSSVRNQGQCGSSWAFSTTAAIESYMKQTSSQTYDLSEQQLLDCAYDGASVQACVGAWPKSAFKYIQTQGLVTEAEYPYVAARQSKCKTEAGSVKPKGYRIVSKNQESLKAAVAIRPVSVCFDASQLDLYESEIVNKYCDGTPNYCGLLVGYDSESWIVQTSFGELWGEEGIVRIEMGDTCGITQYAMYPL